MSTTDRAWTAPGTQQVTNAAFEKPAAGGQQYPLMVIATGQFPDVYKDKPRPEWPQDQPTPGQPPKPKPPKEEGEAKPITPAPGKLILMGCSEMFRKNFLQAGNLDLFMNSVDAVSLSDDIVNIRSRKPTERMIDMPSATTRRVWKIVNYTLATAIIAGVGIATTLMRRRARNAYTMAYGTVEE
jgi:ABC-type uncharacterized transport system involved in gliding motility auxiliary subunit